MFIAQTNTDSNFRHKFTNYFIQTKFKIHKIKQTYYSKNRFKVMHITNVNK